MSRRGRAAASASAPLREDVSSFILSSLEYEQVVEVSDIVGLDLPTPKTKKKNAKPLQSPPL